ncbi:MAG: tetratricopeptide repeat protein [Azospirillaceae bacterium]|nr:tetratricopeptide repeat protein [Azospirillaceae bacterium]
MGTGIASGDDISPLFAAAVADHQAGNLRAAVQGYLAVLALRADLPEVLVNLGLASLSLGAPEAALAACRKALGLKPDYPLARYLSGEVLSVMERFEEAASAFRTVIVAQPDHSEAWHDLGVALRGQGRSDRAVAPFHHALILAGDFPEAAVNLAIALFDVGAWGAAATAGRRALARNPQDAALYDLLGRAQLAQGDDDGALTRFRHALVIRPDDPATLNNAANLLKAHGRIDPAVAAYRHAIAIAPGLGDAYTHLSMALVTQDAPAAVAAGRRALHLAPHQAEAYCSLGTALAADDQFDAAVAALHRSISLRPDLGPTYSDFGNILHARAMVDDDAARHRHALTCYRRALSLDPAAFRAYDNLGTALLESGHGDAALGAYRHAIALQPGLARLHLHHGIALLQQGRFAEGWADYEWRRWTRPPPSQPQPTLPDWRGEPLAGRTILIEAEQGFGDTLMFVRYAPLLAARGGRVILRVPAPLTRLIGMVPGVAGTVGPGEPVPDACCRLPLLSLPRRFGTDAATIPATVPYLRADPGAVAAWQARLASVSGLRVGLVWAGDPRPTHHAAHRIDGRRSLTLDRFGIMAGIAGVRWISLQKGAAAEQARTPPAGMTLIDPMAAIADFADTAALVAALDLIITVDTAVAHLAGGLGKPVWILSRFDACWRWLCDRDDSPWYPTARLFRQQRPGAWTPVLERVRQAVALAATSVTAASTAGETVMS